jgi:hypothetical protein
LAVEPTSAESSQDLLNAPSDRCANCGSPLAPDQRYCVECGERRGKARFSFDTLAAPKPAPAAPKRPRRPRISSSFSFILGVATLLLALGVGVLIGHNTNNPKPVASGTPNQTIKVEGVGGSNNGNSNTKAAKNNKSFTAPKTPKLTKKVIQKVQAAASTVLGSGTKNLSSNPQQQVGQKCSGGNGCQGGKFTGNFFH